MLTAAELEEKSSVLRGDASVCRHVEYDGRNAAVTLTVLACKTKWGSFCGKLGVLPADLIYGDLVEPCNALCLLVAAVRRWPHLYILALLPGPGGHCGFWRKN